MKENIIIGDLHGVIAEFNELLDKIKYDPAKHRLILVGDIIDRGDDPIGLLHKIREMGLECVLANHEDKAYRWRKYELRRKLTGIPNPEPTPGPQRKKEWKSLTADDLKWIASLPTTINIKDNWYVVHAGMEPGREFDKQEPDNIIKVRYVDKDGLMVRRKENRKFPDDSIFWAKAWKQPYNIVFGHTVFDTPQIFHNLNNTCVGIDCGAVYGGKLTAFNVDRNEFTVIKARKKYY